MTKKKAGSLLPKLTEAEQDLLSHIQDGFQLETDSLGGNPILQRLKDKEEIRPLSANRNTIKALEKRGLISLGKVSRPAHYRVASEKKISRTTQQITLRREPNGARATALRLQIDNTREVVVCRSLQLFREATVKVMVGGIIRGSFRIPLKGNLSFVHLSLSSFHIFNR